MSVQLENGHIRIANEIWDEIIRRDFSKRQKDILLLILRLSYGCNKKTATIPKLKNFAICGVSPTQITKELIYLKECRVIEWDRDAMDFGFNKNYEFWQVNPVMGWDSEMFKELIHLNLRKTSQNMNFTNHELHEKRSLDFMKSEVEEPKNPVVPRVEGLSKDSIKDIQEEEEDNEPRTALQAYQFSFKKHMYTGHIQGYISELFKRGFTDTFVREVFMEMGERGIGADVKYMRKLSEDWISRGIYTRVQAQQNKIAMFKPKTVDVHGEREAQQAERMAAMQKQSDEYGKYEPVI